MKSSLGHFVPNRGYTVPILSLKSNSDQTSCVGLLGVPSQVSKKIEVLDSWNQFLEILSR